MTWYSRPGISNLDPGTRGAAYVCIQYTLIHVLMIQVSSGCIKNGKRQNFQSVQLFFFLYPVGTGTEYVSDIHLAHLISTLHVHDNFTCLLCVSGELPGTSGDDRGGIRGPHRGGSSGCPARSRALLFREHPPYVPPLPGQVF